MENLILDKKLESWGDAGNNFQIANDIMVTITLKEYRALVANNATSNQKIDKLKNENLFLQQQNKELNQTVANLTDTMKLFGVDNKEENA